MPTKARQEKIDQVQRARVPGVRLVLEDIHDPHNAAAILRSADAFGVGAVWYLFLQEEPYDPKRVGKDSSTSANKWVETPVFTDRNEVFTKLAEEEYTSIATTIHESDAERLWESDLKNDHIAIWVGNEHRGLSKETIDRCERKLTIPMRGFVESLNVSVSTAVILSEIIRQRCEKPL